MKISKEEYQRRCTQEMSSLYKQYAEDHIAFMLQCEQLQRLSYRLWESKIIPSNFSVTVEASRIIIEVPSIYHSNTQLK